MLHQLCHPRILTLFVRVADTNGLDDDLDFEKAVDQLLQPRTVFGQDPQPAFCAEAMALDDGFGYDQATDANLKPATVLNVDPQLDICATLCPDPSERASFVAYLQAEIVKCDQVAHEIALQIAEQKYVIGAMQPSKPATVHVPLQPIGQSHFQAALQPHEQSSMQPSSQATHPIDLQAPLHAPQGSPYHPFVQHGDQFPNGADAFAPPPPPQPPYLASAPHHIPHIAHSVSTAAGLIHAPLLGAANASTSVSNLAQALAGNMLQTLDSNMSAASHFSLDALPRADSPTSWTSRLRGRRHRAGQQPPTADADVALQIAKPKQNRKRRMPTAESVLEAVVATQYNSRNEIPTVSAATAEHTNHAAALPPTWYPQLQSDSSGLDQEQSMQQLQTNAVTEEVVMAPPNKRRKRKHVPSTAAPAAAAMAPAIATAIMAPADDQAPAVSPSAAASVVPAMLPAAEPTEPQTAAAAEHAVSCPAPTAAAGFPADTSASSAAAAATKPAAASAPSRPSPRRLRSAPQCRLCLGQVWVLPLVAC